MIPFLYRALTRGLPPFLFTYTFANGREQLSPCDGITVVNVWSAARLQEKSLKRSSVCVNVSGLVGESLSGHWMRFARPCPA